MSTHNMPFSNMKTKNTRNYPKSAAMGFFSKGLKKFERVRKSHGKRAISVRAIEVLLYLGIQGYKLHAFLLLRLNFK